MVVSSVGGIGSAACRSDFGSSQSTLNWVENQPSYLDSNRVEIDSESAKSRKIDFLGVNNKNTLSIKLN